MWKTEWEGKRERIVKPGCAGMAVAQVRGVTEAVEAFELLAKEDSSLLEPKAVKTKTVLNGS